MPYELKEIKQIRKKYGLTQTELAKISGVSQSLIAKIEAGRIDPTYSNAQKIFNSLEALAQKKEIAAEKIMQKQVISVMPETQIKEAIKLMRKHAISQIPVIKKDACLGMISETIILESLIDGKYEKVKDIMGDIPPIISKNTQISIISSLLKAFPLVLVSEEGNITGLITKSDIIKNL